jgi:Uma2 family endonuclease
MALETQTQPALGPEGEHDPFFYGWRYVRRVQADGTKKTEQVPLTREDVLHPREGDFIVNNDDHNIICLYLKDAIRLCLAGRPAARVFQDHRIDWQTAGLKPHGPDIAVLFDSPTWDGRRGTFRVRKEGARPILVLEVTSPSTRDTDLDEKVNEYCLAGIPLYVIVDLRETVQGPEIRLLAYRPSPDGPVRLFLPDPNKIWLNDLDVWLTVEGNRVVCVKADGKPLDDYVVVAQQAEQAEARARAEARKVKTAKAKAQRERERADNEQQRADNEQQRADNEQQRADNEQQRADNEQQRADAAARKITELEAKLKKLQGS